jgi:hypothetical protein
MHSSPLQAKQYLFAFLRSFFSWAMPSFVSEPRDSVSHWKAGISVPTKLSREFCSAHTWETGNINASSATLIANDISSSRSRIVTVDNYFKPHFPQIASVSDQAFLHQQVRLVALGRKWSRSERPPTCQPKGGRLITK